MIIVDYRLVTGSIEVVEHDVKSLISAGWQPLGAFAFIFDRHSHGVQTMVRRRELGQIGPDGKIEWLTREPPHLNEV